MSFEYNIVALLPMKANSERVKGKNFRNFCGKPLFRWVLDNLLLENRIEKIIINTDARLILESNGLVENDKIIIRDRPKAICGDFVSMNKIIENDIKNVSAKTYLMTHTTNPLLSLRSIKNALNIYEQGKSEGFDSLFSVNKIQTRLYDENMKAINHDPNNLVRTQDLAPLFEENSNLYLFSKDSFKKTQARIGKKPKVLITEPFESTDVDTQSDWDLAEVLVAYFRKKGLIN